MTTEEDDDTPDRRRRIYNVYRTGLLCSSLLVYFFAGAFYGYGPMILLLQGDGAFFSKCSDKNTGTDDELNYCPDQKSQLLNIHFAGSLMLLSTPFIGHLCDTKGPFITMFFAAITALAGVALLIVSRAIPMDELLYPAFCFLRITPCATSVLCAVTGGVFARYSNTAKEQVGQGQADMDLIEEVHTQCIPQERESSSTDRRIESNKGSEYERQGNGDCDRPNKEQAGPQEKGPRRVIGLLANLFDVGTITYLIMYEAQKSFGTSLQVLCYLYLGAGVLIFGAALACWMLVLRHQQEDKELKQEEQANRIRKSLLVLVEEDGPSARALKMEQQEPSMPTSTELAAEEEKVKEDKWRELVSAPFLWLVAFYSFHICRNVFVLTTAEAFLKDLGDTDDKYIRIFAMLMPASILGFPVVDWAMGKYGYHKALQLVNVLCLAHGIIQISATSNLNIQIIGFLFFSFYRCFLFSVTFACLAVLMPENVVGKANGMMTLAAGVASFLNIPLGNAAIHQWNGDFFIPNCIYTFGILPFFYAAYGATIGIHNNQDQGIDIKRNSGNPLPSSPAMDDEVARA
ncbi:MAG: hypothetical protein SGBAC_004481 [Bacillariaceae sp.]